MTAQVLRRYSSKSNAAALAASPSKPLPAPTRLSLVAEYFALQNAHPYKSSSPSHSPPSSSPAPAPAEEEEDDDLDSPPPSTASATTATSTSASSTTASPPPTALRARRAHLRQRRILATLYPTHPALDAPLRARARHASRAVALKATMAAHTLALAKLAEAANLLLLAADHAALLLAASSSSSSSSSASSASSVSSSASSASVASAPRTAALSAATPPLPPRSRRSPRSDELVGLSTTGSGCVPALRLAPRASSPPSTSTATPPSPPPPTSPPPSSPSATPTSPTPAPATRSSASATRRRASSAELVLGSGCLPELGVPAPFRMRYVRRCWGLAGEALAAAVALSTLLARAARRNRAGELVPGVEARAKRLGLGLGRREVLARLAAEAAEARAAALAWHTRQRRFLGKLRRELVRRRRAAAALDERVACVRREMMMREFEARIVSAIPATA